MSQNNLFNNTDVDKVDRINMKYDLIITYFDPTHPAITAPKKDQLNPYIRNILNTYEYVELGEDSFTFYYNEIFSPGMDIAETKNNTPISDFDLNNLTNSNLNSILGTLGESIGYLVYRRLVDLDIMNYFFQSSLLPTELRQPPDWLVEITEPGVNYRYLSADSKATTTLEDPQVLMNYSRYREKVVEGLNSAFRGVYRFLGRPEVDPDLWSQNIMATFVTAILKPNTALVINNDENGSSINLGRTLGVVCLPDMSFLD